MYILIMLFLLSILVLVHELGHFAVARWRGIKVDKFGFGLPFGPTLYETNWGDTKVCIHAFLLGGYVGFPDDDPESDLPKDDPSRISNKKIWERFLVISAGVTANVVIAYFIVLFVALFSGGLPTGKYNIYVDKILNDKKLAAYSSTLKTGDRLLSVNGEKIDSPVKFIEIARRSKKFDGYVDNEAFTNRLEKITSLNPGLSKELSSGGLLPKGLKINLPQYKPEKEIDLNGGDIASLVNYKPEGTSLSEEQRALRDKVFNKTYIVSDGKYSLADLAIASADTAHAINIKAFRNGKVIAIPTIFPDEKGIIGLKLKSEEIVTPVKSPWSAVTVSYSYLQRNAYYMISGLGLIFTGKIPLNDLHGIVAITKVGGDIIQNQGIWEGLLLTALISLDLAIVNLLPIPALDGGHLLFLFIESLRGRPVKEETQEAFAKWGFAFLIGLMVLIIFNDIWALVTDKL